MSNGTAIAVAAWVALVAAPIFLQPSAPVSDAEAVRALLEVRIRAVRDGDDPTQRATSARDFGGSWIGVGQAPVPWVEPSGSTVRVDWASLHFPTAGVATVSGTWERPQGGARLEAAGWGLLTYVLRMQNRQWLVSRVTLLTAVRGSASASGAPGTEDHP